MINYVEVLFALTCHIGAKVKELGTVLVICCPVLNWFLKYAQYLHVTFNTQEYLKNQNLLKFI